MCTLLLGRSVAVRNSRDAGEHAWYNCWVPLQPVREDPLGVIAPASVNIPKEGTGYMGFGTSIVDRTGIVESAGHRWYWAPDMRPGDALLWRSEETYHCAMRGGGEGGGRRSADMRISWA